MSQLGWFFLTGFLAGLGCGLLMIHFMKSPIEKRLQQAETNMRVLLVKIDQLHKELGI